MENHPLNPMTDANLVRWLKRQTDAAVDLIALATVRKGMDAIRAKLEEESSSSKIFVVDAIKNKDLRAIGTAIVRYPLVTGGSGIALGLPNAYRAAGLLPAERSKAALPKVDGKQAILAGSCSSMTLKQVEYMKERCPSCQLLLEDVLKRSGLVAEVLEWAKPLLEKDRSSYTVRPIRPR
jgi:uncharacterized protein YgbK (DUF1537 family)